MTTTTIRSSPLLIGLVWVGLVAPEANAQGGRPAEPNRAEIYEPALEQTLTAELHFIKMVCNPSEAQFERIHRAGIKAVSEIARTYGRLQQDRKSPETWPLPSESITQRLQQAVDEVMPADTATEYRAEITARLEAARAANAAVIVDLVDQRTVLDPNQQQKLLADIQRNWNPNWSQASVVLLYPQYAQLPGPDFVNPHLSDLQQRLWSYRPKPRDVRLSWEIYLGTNDLLGPGHLPSFDRPPPDPGEEAP